MTQAIGAGRSSTIRGCLSALLKAVVPLALILAPAIARPDPSRPAPPFTLPTSQGSVTLESLRGRVVLVDFWASWCVPCRSSFAWMKSMHETYGPRGLSIVAIDLDKDRHAADRFLAQATPPFTIAFDPAGRTAAAYRVKAMPTSFLVGPTGTIVHTHSGFDAHKARSLEKLIQEACTP